MNSIHAVKVGDLVRSIRYSYSPSRRKDITSSEVFMVMAITSPIGFEWYRGNPLYTHEISLKLWEVTEPPSHTHYAQSNLYEVV